MSDIKRSCGNCRHCSPFGGTDARWCDRFEDFIYDYTWPCRFYHLKAKES